MDITSNMNTPDNDNNFTFDDDYHLCTNETRCSHTLDNRFWRIRGEAHHPILAVLYSIFVVVAFGWNLFILIVMVKKRTTFKLPAHVAIFSLSVINIITCVIVVLPMVITQATQEWIFFDDSDCGRCIVCGFQGAIVVLLVDVALHILALMSFDRMLLLVKPLTYKEYINKRKMLIAIIVVTVLCILVVVPPFCGFGEIDFNRNLGVCLPRFTGSDGQQFYIGFCLIEALFPLITLIVTSVWTYRVIGRSLKTNHIRRKSLHRRKSMQEMNEVTHHKGQQRQLARVFGAFLVAYIFAWSPIVVVGFVFVFSGGRNDGKVPAQVFVFGFLCYLSNILFQPVLETLFISDLRTELVSVKKNIGESIRTGTGAMIKKGSELSHRISNSLMDVSLTTATESPLGSRHSRFSPSPLRRTQSDSGFEEDSQANGTILSYGSNRSLNLSKSHKKTRFEGSIELDVVKPSALASLEPIPESSTLERGATLSHFVFEVDVHEESSFSDVNTAEPSGSATLGDIEEGVPTNGTSSGPENTGMAYSPDMPEFPSSPDLSDSPDILRLSSSPDIPDVPSSPKAVNQLTLSSENEVNSIDEIQQ
ncbi:G-protein coupled receptor 161-like [Dysidea avara]|uniref:G-protein coupled receptor 161-like n=1 Tax=Dysidea avara TaxID=196820 RepID=UPI00331FBEA3